MKNNYPERLAQAVAPLARTPESQEAFLSNIPRSLALSDEEKAYIRRTLAELGAEAIQGVRELVSPEAIAEFEKHMKAFDAESETP